MPIRAMNAAGRALGRFGIVPISLSEDSLLAAASRQAQVGPLDVSLALSVSHWEDGTVVPGGGAEISYWPVPGRTFFARIGGRYVDDSDIRPLTLGAGFSADQISIDYAFGDFDGGDAVHRFGIRLR